MIVPNSLIFVVLLVAFGTGWFNYFVFLPKRAVINVKFLIMVGPAAIMIVTVVLAVVDVHAAWLSYLLLALAIACLGIAIPRARRSMEEARARDREIAERRASGG